jgi:fatty-acyl-CoA synthase
MPGPRTLPEALDEASTTGAGYTFLTDAGARYRSYADLREASLHLAGGLHRADVKPGAVVALLLSDAEQFLTTLCGAILAGMVPASLYPPAPTASPERYLDTTISAIRASGARAVVTTPEWSSWLEPFRGGGSALDAVLTFDALAAASPAEPRQPALDDIALVQYTSGSTSSPKGVVLTQANLSANIEAINGPDGLAASHEDRGVSWLPLYHDMGLIGMSLCALYCARPVVLMTPDRFVKRPVEWLRAISQYRGTISFAPNFAYDLCVRRVKDRDLASLDLSSWRVAGCGAEPVNARTLAAFAEKFAPAGFRESSFLPSYGLAEHVLAATFPPRDRAPRVHQIAAGELADSGIAVVVPDGAESSVRLVSCGRPLSGHAIRIVTEDGGPAAENQVGEIALKGPSVMLGYYKDELLTRRTIRDGWLHTGDLGYLSGGELFVCGRSKDLIIVSGRKYHPQDIEWSLDEVSGLRRGRAVAFGAAGEDGPERIVIVAEPSGTAPPAAVAAEIRRRVGDGCGLAVSDVLLVPAGTIGRTTSGKVQRARLRAAYERGELTSAARPTEIQV